MLPSLLLLLKQWEQWQQSWHGGLRWGSSSNRGDTGRDEEVLPRVIFGGNNTSLSQVQGIPIIIKKQHVPGKGVPMVCLSNVDTG